MDPHEELLQHLQSIPGPVTIEEQVTAAWNNEGRPIERPRCPECGQMKPRPSTPCPKCGRDDVSMTNDEYYGGPHAQEAARARYDAEHGWWPESLDQAAKSYGREPQRPPVQRVQRQPDELDDLAW